MEDEHLLDDLRLALVTQGVATTACSTQSVAAARALADYHQALTKLKRAGTQLAQHPGASATVIDIARRHSEEASRLERLVQCAAFLLRRQNFAAMMDSFRTLSRDWPEEGDQMVEEEKREAARAALAGGGD